MSGRLAVWKRVPPSTVVQSTLVTVYLDSGFTLEMEGSAILVKDASGRTVVQINVPAGYPDLPNEVSYMEHIETLDTVETTDGAVWTMVRTDEGLRVWHVTTEGDTYCEWPVLLRLAGSPYVRWAAYNFNGLRNSPSPNQNIPDGVSEWVRRYLLQGARV